jgi:hypothetical protein
MSSISHKVVSHALMQAERSHPLSRCGSLLIRVSQVRRPAAIRSVTDTRLLLWFFSSSLLEPSGRFLPEG